MTRVSSEDFGQFLMDVIERGSCWGGICLVLIGSLNFIVVPAGSMVFAYESPLGIKQEIQQLQTKGIPQSTDPTALTYLAGLYLDLGNETSQDKEARISAYEEGARLAQKAIQLKEDLANAHFYYAANLGSAAHLQGVLASVLNLQELKFHVYRAIELQEDHAPALHMIGMMLEELPWFLGGDSERALYYLQKAVAVDEDYMHARVDLGKAYLERQNINQAIEEFQIVAKTRPASKVKAWAQQYQPEAERLLMEIGREYQNY